MLKGAIFLDMENLMRCGGWNIRFDAVRELVEAQGVTVVRANAYMAVDEEREEDDEEYRKKKLEYRSAVRRAGFHLVRTKVKRYDNADGETVLKANADVDLAIDALLQSENLDYILLGSGDGDFVRLVRALQNRGKRVDLLSFDNTSTELRREVDYHFSGFLYPGILPKPDDEADNRKRGFIHMVDEEKGYGFATIKTGFQPDDQRTDVFVHITDFRRNLDNEEFARLKTYEDIIEFDLVENEDGVQAKNIEVVG
ncbi:MAG: NYN domain-containing protein [Bradymonadaceae bacterium]